MLPSAPCSPSLPVADVCSTESKGPLPGGEGLPSPLQGLVVAEHLLTSMIQFWGPLPILSKLNTTSRLCFSVPSDLCQIQ